MEKIVSAEDLHKLPHKYQVMFAVFCAEQVVGLIREQDREVCVKAIEVTKKWLRGEVSKEECRAAANAAYTTYAAVRAARAAAGAACAAATYAAHATYTTYTAGSAACTAIYAANAIYAFHAGENRNNLVKEQWNYYYELLNLDETLEKILVG
jgi:hypothetical protein